MMKSLIGGRVNSKVVRCTFWKMRVEGKCRLSSDTTSDS